MNASAVAAATRLIARIICSLPVLLPYERVACRIGGMWPLRLNWRRDVIEAVSTVARGLERARVLPAPAWISLRFGMAAMGRGRVKTQYPDENEQSYCS